MYEMTMTDFLAVCNSPFAKEEANWLVIKVQVGDSAPEIILNPKENFEAKLAYYAQAYDENLVLKANPSIKIISYDMVKNLHYYFE